MDGPDHLFSDTVVFRDILDDKIIFRFRDYRVNYSTCFSVDFDLPFGTLMTKMAFIGLFAEGI